MKKLCGYTLFTLVMLTFLVSAALAQTGVVKGTITDDQTGATLPGANVFLERTSFGAATDENGIYTIPTVLAGNYTLVVSYVGYTQFRQAVTVRSGETTTLDIKLKPSSVQLNPVVVTAIGTQANREQLGTTVSSIDATAISTSGAHDIITSIAALAPGVNTIETTGDPGAATRIVLRGVRSLQNDNQPLIVLDGIPVFSGQSIGGGYNYTAAETRINDINPNDIKSIEVYKGPSASALWGARAANGVIAITTKSGGQTGSKKLSVTVRSKTWVDQLLRDYPLQQKFGQGQSGKFLFNGVRSWGDPIWMRSGAADVLDRTNYAYATITQKNSTVTYNHSSELFRSPVTEDYGVTLRGGDEWSDFYVDFGQLNQQGIILANSDLHTTSIRANATRRFTEDVIVKATASYIKSTTSRIGQGSNVSGLFLGGLRCPPDFNNKPYIVDYVASDGAVTQGMQRSYRNSSADPALGPGFDNPFYVINNLPTTLSTNRLIGTVDITYNALDWLGFQYIMGADYYTDRTLQTFPVGDATWPTGETYRNANSNYLVNADLRGTAKHSFSEDIDASLMLGFHLDHLRSEGISVDASNFILADAPATFSNALDYFPGEGLTMVRTAAFYGEATGSLYKQVFLRATGRMESASTYGPDVKQTYFYPSASVAWQFTEFQPVKDIVPDRSILSFGKLRAAIGTAANRPGAYQTKTYYYNPGPGNGWQTGINGIYYGGAAVRSSNLGNSTLKPEMTTETEFGTDLRFLNDRISFSYTHYINKTTDALLPVTVAAASGFTSRTANAAKLENTGDEIQVIGEWLRIEPFSWTTTINWAANKNKCTDLSGVDRYDLAGFVGTLSSVILNQPVGVLFGTKWARNADNSLLLDANGFPKLAAQPGILGDPNPDFRLGFINTLRFERLALNVVLDWKKGGKVWNGTKGALYSYGTDEDVAKWTTISATQASTLKNWQGRTPAQVILTAGQKQYYQNADGTVSFRGTVHNFGSGDVILDEIWYRVGLGGGFNGPSEQFIEDGSYIRLREVTLSYALPLQFLGMQAMTVSVTGRNLWLSTDYHGIDPETNLWGPNTNGIGLDYFNNPSTKSWIVSLQFEY